ncbi:hypothetical protein [Nostoc sp. FACHB-888]|uniref:hypothetical protein n=1 Tax=Nostoc sp. FACHB-888 TaxID=2692842 RepID=UPI0019887DEB|nr:hypothetical protein [Nostoc sp. FACHB-888]MBD2247797.1 hypothetical protein [Nostoc sp. FACHB-888]
MDMRELIQKRSKLVRKKIDVTPSSTESIAHEKVQETESVIESSPSYKISESDSIKEHYRPLRSLGNSGWQPSDVWRELRVDDFCG